MGERLEGDEAKTMSGKASSSVNVNAFGIGNGHTNTAQRQEKKVEEDEEALATMCRRSMHAWDGIFHSNCSWDEDDDEDDEHAVDEMRLLPLAILIWLLKGV